MRKLLGHVKAKCWSKGGQEGQFPWNNNRWTSNTINSITDTPIMWAYGSSDGSDTWFSDSATTIHISPNQEDFSSYQKYDQECSIKAFGKNSVKGIGKGDIDVNIMWWKGHENPSLSSYAHTRGWRKHSISENPSSKGFSKSCLGRLNPASQRTT